MRKRRNPVARAAILRKGGAHVKPKSGQRAEQERRLQQETAEALQERKPAGKKTRRRGKTAVKGKK